ncbi:DUF2798 domain-containing protein [Zobellella sp. DQSA1]|uniref:DUF2798 domain-containing protein n=1 Tax=Zobellella sp. DQSA1 TaxID=3342386 RepID=UPI0035BEFD5B
MSPKHRLLFALLMSLVLSFLMTAWVTWLNLGLIEGFVEKWMSAFIVAWPAAALISLLFGPWVQRLTGWMMSRRSRT